jgi:predicted amidohydrolase YtcJ
VGATKLFADGGIAIAIDVTMHGHPIRYGMTMSDLTERALAAAERGFDVAVHAIGNVGVDAAIGAFRAVRSQRFGDRRALRIEHVGIASRQQCAELAALGVTAVVQPNFVEHVGTSSAGARFDHHHWLPFRSLADAGVALAASSDDPCAPWSPLWGAIRGAARTTLAGAAFEPEEALGMDRWLQAMTAGAAAAGGQSHERGTLAPGLRADLVELRGRLSSPEHPDDPDAPRVCGTWVGGERVWATAG